MPAADPFAGFAGVLHEEPLSRHSQFGVGGPAQWYLSVGDAPTLCAVTARATAAGVPVTVLGAGSNTLIPDTGLRGLVLRLADRTTRRVDGGSLELAAACMLPRVALDCARRGLAGLEFGIGVPGTAGASVAGNAGAFGAEIRDVLIDCTLLDGEGTLRVVTADQLGLAYRHSRLKTDLAGTIVVSARFRVHEDDPAAVRRRTDAIQAQRKATQPYGVRSLGSVFKNPPADAAGRLIEACRLKRARTGGAEISAKHANFIVNRDHASAADVLSLVARAHDAVAERFGIALEREIVVLEPRRAVAARPAQPV